MWSLAASIEATTSLTKLALASSAGLCTIESGVMQDGMRSSMQVGRPPTVVTSGCVVDQVRAL